MESGAASRLSQISTAWTLLYRAHEGVAEEAKAARRQLLQDYGGPVYRYLWAAVGDPDAANDLYQDFALRFVQGSFKNADPQHGRFRDFLKTVLYHLIVDHQRRRSAAAQPLPDQTDLAGFGCAYTSLVPTQLRRLLAAGADLTGFATILLGGAAAPAGLLDAARPAGADFSLRAKRLFSALT